MKKVKHRKNCNLFNSENIYSFNKTHLFDEEKRQKMKLFFHGTFFASEYAEKQISAHS